MHKMRSILVASMAALLLAGCATSEPSYEPPFVAAIEAETGAKVLPSYAESDNGKDVNGNQGQGKSDPSKSKQDSDQYNADCSAGSSCKGTVPPQGNIHNKNTKHGKKTNKKGQDEDWYNPEPGSGGDGGFIDIGGDNCGACYDGGNGGRN